MAQRQPNVMNVRNGPSRGRSRSISRSRSRSRSPPAAREPRDDVVRDDQRTTWTLAPNGDQLWGGMVLRRQVESGATVTLREMKAVVGPRTDAALMKLLEDSFPEEFLTIALDDPIPISTLAEFVGPETMAPLCLASILVGVAKANAAQQAAKDKQDAELQLQRLRTEGRKVMLDELHKVAMKSFHVNTHTAFLDLVETVGNKHPDIGLDTIIDLDMVAAETGPETMSLSNLIKLVLAAPAARPQPSYADLLLVMKKPEPKYILL